jgi:hypothetical protein
MMGMKRSEGMTDHNDSIPDFFPSFLDLFSDFLLPAVRTESRGILRKGNDAQLRFPP